MKSALNSRFELTGYEMSRLIKISVFGKFVPIGNLRGGPGGRCLCVLSLLHYFGFWGYWLKAKHGHRLNFIKPMYRRIKR
ncbi:MAG: hypothetical protein COA36_07055 [Desulfotalea sp.]|nr:MAG: hypothetical protein COA36_07055 [Desulfotalea sp.]